MAQFWNTGGGVNFNFEHARTHTWASVQADQAHRQDGVLIRDLVRMPATQTPVTVGHWRWRWRLPAFSASARG